jgi:hypothetical protein
MRDSRTDGCLSGWAGFEEATNICVYRNELITELK